MARDDRKKNDKSKKDPFFEMVREAVHDALFERQFGKKHEIKKPEKN